MSNNDHDEKELAALVLTAERERDRKNTTALQEYMDNHPKMAQSTLALTGEIRQKLCYYISNADQNAQEKLQTELNTLRDYLANLSEKPNILHSLLCEEIELSYLFLRHADTLYARHYSNISTIALRRIDMASIRFLRALKTLASIHQRLPHIVNVNLGNQQIVQH